MRRDASLSHSNGEERKREREQTFPRRVEREWRVGTDGDGEMKMEMERATDFSV